MSGFGTTFCGICGRRCRWDDDVCSDVCQEEADRRGERLAILTPTAPGHSAAFVGEESEDFARIECECGWVEECVGFDAGAFAQSAYQDHLDQLHPEGDQRGQQGYDREAQHDPAAPSQHKEDDPIMERPS